MLRYKHNARPEKVIYRSLAASILVGSFFYTLKLIIPQIFLIEITNLLPNLLRAFGSYLGMILIAIFAFLPIWFVFGFAVYMIISLPKPDASKKLMAVIVYLVLLLIYRWLFSIGEKWTSVLDYVSSLIDVICFAIPAVYMIYHTHWLGVSEPRKRPKQRHYDDLLDH